MVRIFARTLLALAISGPSLGFALGLGEIRLHSALNERLDADIELLSVAAGDANTVSVTLAPPETFNQAGVDRASELSHLRFSVRQGPDGRHIVKVSSERPIREPFLDFIIEVNWRAGRLLREYTLLLDPPASLREPPPTLRAPTTPAAARAAAPAPYAAPSVSTSAAGGSDGDQPLVYGPVKPDESLWVIAQRVRPNDSVSVHQMAIALLRANPGAFIGGSINHLRRGAVLRIEDRALITALTREEARREFDQLSRRRQDTAARLAAEAAGRSAAGEQKAPAQAGAAPAGVATPPQSQLKLVAPEDLGKKLGAEDEAAYRALKEEFQKTLEVTEAQQRENEELRKRLAALEDQLASLQRLLVLKEQSLAQLQTGLQQGQRPPAEPAPGAAQPGAQPPSVTVPPTGSPPPAAAAPPAPKAAMPPPPAPEEGLLDLLLQDPTLLAAAGGSALMLVLLVLLILRRRAAAKGGLHDNLLAVSAGSEDEEGSGSAETSFLTDLGDSSGPGPSSEDAEVDPLTEADVYIAYGRHQQAEELLKQAIRKEPRRPELLVKLLEVYYLTRNTAGFNAQANAAFSALDGSGPLWNKVQAMGHDLCPENPLFAEAPSGHGALPQGQEKESSMLDDVLDIGLDLEALAAEMEPGHEIGGGKRDEDDLGLDLDLDFSALEGSTPAKPRAAAPRAAPVAAARPAAAAAVAAAVLAEPDDEDWMAAMEAPAAAALPRPAAAPAAKDELDNFDLELSQLDLAALLHDGEAEPQQPPVPPAPAPAPAVPVPEASSDDNLLDFDLSGFQPAAEEPAAEPPGAEDGHLLDFDLGDFKLLQDDSGSDADQLEIPAVGGADDLASFFGKALAPGVAETAPTGGPAVVEEELDFRDLEGLAFDQEPAAPAAAEPVDGADESLDLAAELAALEGVAAPAPQGRDESFDLAADLGIDLEAFEQADFGLDLTAAEEPAAPVDGEILAEELDLGEMDLRAPAAEEPMPDLFDSGLNPDELALAEAELAAEMEGVAEEPPQQSAEQADDLGGLDLSALDDLDGLEFGGDDDSLLGELDEVGTKLDLATAYVEMGDAEGAREMLDEVLRDGDAEQRQKARELLGRLAS